MDHEAEAIYRRANHCGTEGSGGRSEDEGAVPATALALILSLAVIVVIFVALILVSFVLVRVTSAASSIAEPSWAKVTRYVASSRMAATAMLAIVRSGVRSGPALAVSRNHIDVAGQNRTGLVHRGTRHGSQKKALRNCMLCTAHTGCPLSIK